MPTVQDPAPRTAALPGVEGSVDASKQALLTAIAQQGQVGTQAFVAEAGRQQAAQQAAIAGIAAQTSGGPGRGFAAPAALASQLGAQQTALQNIYNMDRGMAQATFGNSMGLVRDSNAAYMDQARASVPVLRAQTEGLIAQERSRLEQERLQMEQARLDAIEAQKEREFNAWQRQQERDAANALTGGHDPADVEKIAAWMTNRQAQVSSYANADDETEIPVTLVDDAGNKVTQNLPVGETFNAIVASAPDLETAINIANSSWEEGEPLIPHKRLLDYLYQYYTGKSQVYKGRTGNEDLYNALVAEGIDGATAIPAYDPNAEPAETTATPTGHPINPASIALYTAAAKTPAQIRWLQLAKLGYPTSVIGDFPPDSVTDTRAIYRGPFSAQSRNSAVDQFFGSGGGGQTRTPTTDIYGRKPS